VLQGKSQEDWLSTHRALCARPGRRGLPKDRGERSAIAANVLDCQFQADAPHQKWVVGLGN
jgi:putative transposase